MCFSSKLKSYGTQKWGRNVISSIPIYCKGKGHLIFKKSMHCNTKFNTDGRKCPGYWIAKHIAKFSVLPKRACVISSFLKLWMLLFMKLGKAKSEGMEWYSVSWSTSCWLHRSPVGFVRLVMLFQRLRINFI